MKRIPLFLLTLTACGDAVGPGERTDATVRLTAALAGVVEGLTVEITAPDLDRPLLQNVPVVGDTAAGTLTIPAGADRILTVRGLDAGGAETHRGVDTLDVMPGDNVALTLVLEPLNGDVPVTVELATYAVAITPADTTVAADGSFTYAVSVTDADGTPVFSPALAWGSTNPDVARVDGTGALTAVAAGTATIAVNYRGSVALATVTVAP